MSDQLREAIEHWYDDTEHGICPHSLRDEEAVLDAARKWLAVSEAETVEAGKWPGKFWSIPVYEPGTYVVIPVSTEGET